MGPAIGRIADYRSRRELPMATRIPSAVARKEMAAVLKRAARGERIKVTKHAKTIAVLIPKRDLASLEDCEDEQKRTRHRSSGSR